MHLKPICALQAAAPLSVFSAQAETYHWDSVAMAKAPAIDGGFGRPALSADGGVLPHSPVRKSATYRSTNYGAS